jgi:endonuclease YncB( thermonuclease family)
MSLSRFVAATMVMVATTTTAPSIANANSPIQTGDLVSGSVYDGDSFRLRSPDGEELIIRLTCVDAPELSQENGRRSRDVLRRLLESGTIQYRVVTRDRYGRTIADVWQTNPMTRNKIFIPETLARVGLAYPYARYQDDCADYEAVENATDRARANDLGVWGDPDAITPWDYRRNR